MKLSPDYLLREIAGEYLLVPVGANDGKAGLVQLNELSAFILSHLDGQKTVDDIADAILAEFEADRQTVLKDVKAFTAQMTEIGVIV